MADFACPQTSNGGLDEDDDYMGNLSKFIPQEVIDPPRASSKKVSINKNPEIQSSKKKAKTLSWQQKRDLNRKEKQHEEDKEILAKIEAPISESNIGFKMLKNMGYTPGLGLGKEGSGMAEPVGLEIRRSRAGLGREAQLREKRRREELEEEMKRRNSEVLVEDFEIRQKSQWRSRRVTVNYLKAKATLDRLENKEIVVLKKSEDDETIEEEEEEEEITEEDMLEILKKLQEEHKYCLFCGCQYESMEALMSNCPGLDEDDH